MFQQQSNHLLVLCRQLLHAGSMSSATALQALRKLASNNISLTQCAQDIMSMPVSAQEADLLLVSQQCKGEPILQQSTITCMATLKKSHDEVRPQPVSIHLSVGPALDDRAGIRL